MRKNFLDLPDFLSIFGIADYFICVNIHWMTKNIFCASFLIIVLSGSAEELYDILLSGVR